MGFLTVKTETYDYPASKPLQNQIKANGILQLINLWHKHKEVQKADLDLKWGDEVEYHVFTLKDDEKVAQLWADGFKNVNDVQKENPVDDFIYQEEFGSWMVESVPVKPYSLPISKKHTNQSLKALKNYMARRNLMNERIQFNSLYFLSMPCFPTAGEGAFFDSEDYDLASLNTRTGQFEDENDASQSKYFLDKLANPHNRFPTLMRNIRQRRGKKVEINVPVFQDTNTKEQVVEMDAMFFGMGMSCLQLTYECQNYEHARYLHDSLMSFGGIFAALSAACVIQRGRLTDRDLRWQSIVDSVDSRTQEEIDSGKFPKSRYSGMNHYLSDHPNFVHESLQDTKKPPLNQTYKAQLTEAGIPDRLAEHFALLFAHDALVIYKGHTDYDENTTEHFEQFNSTNWNSMRFKPPPSLNSLIGWRVEFRTLDVQLTDFENAAFTALMHLLVQFLNDRKDINTAMPISLQDINLDRAHTRDAVNQEKFWWPTSIVAPSPTERNNWNVEQKEANTPQEVKEQTLNQIMNGEDGIVTLLKNYLETLELSDKDTHFYMTMLDFMGKRASGQILTGASYIRKMVQEHPDYKQDSIVTPEINYDIVRHIAMIGGHNEEVWPEDLLGEKPEFIDELLEEISNQ